MALLGALGLRLVALGAACVDDDAALRQALSPPAAAPPPPPCRVPMCRHRCRAAAAEGLCEPERAPAAAVRRACPAACGTCGSLPDDGEGPPSSADEDSCDIPRIADARRLTPADFHAEYVLPRRPVVLGGLLDHWAARRWLGVGAAGAPATAADWARQPPVEESEESGAGSANDAAGRAFFGTELGRARRLGKNQYFNLDYTPHDPAARSALQAGYATPTLFRGDILRRACHPSLPHRWLMLSANGSGSAWHVDPFNASAWNGLLKGRKRWALSPPERGTPAGLPPGPAVGPRYDYWDPASNRGGWWGITQPFERPDVGAREYFESVLPGLAASARPLLCTLRAGELIYLPSGWYHAVVNLSPTIAYTETWTGPADGSEGGAAAQVIAELRKRPEVLWEGEGEGQPAAVPTMTSGCLRDLRAGFPPLFGGPPEGGGEERHTCSDDAAAGAELQGVAVDTCWELPKRERTVAAAVARHGGPRLPLVVVGSKAEGWEMNRLWNASSFWMAWDEGLMPSLRRVHGHSSQRPRRDVVECGSAASEGARECNGDNTEPLPVVFGADSEPTLRFWRGDMSALGRTLRKDVGTREGKVVDEIPLSDWRDILLFEVHKKHDHSKGMAAIQALRRQHPGEAFYSLLDQLARRFGEDPQALWEEKMAGVLLAPQSGGGGAPRYGGVEVSLGSVRCDTYFLGVVAPAVSLADQKSARYIQAGVRLRARQLRDGLSLLQVCGTRTLTLFRPKDARLLRPYPSSHPAHPHAQLSNLSRAIEAGASARRVLLTPGDVLYVPAFWWVHEQVEEDSISFEVLSRDTERRAAEAALMAAAIPLDDWGERATRRALGLYLALLVAELAPRPAGVSRHDVEAPLARGKRCGRWITGWLRSRFGDPDEGSGQDGGAESADVDVCAMDWPLPPGGEPALQERFRKAAATVSTALLPLSGARPSVATTLLEEYLETVTSYVLGRSELVAFFERCVVPVVPEVATWA